MLLISEADVKEALTMANVIETVMSAYGDYSEKLIEIPSRITMKVRDESDSAIFLTANYLSRPFYGIKQASSFPSNINKEKSTVLSDIHLYSADTGELLAVVSANYLTAIKTGAASAVATKFLAREGDSILAIIGTGVQARTQLAGIQKVRPLEEVRLYDLEKRKVKEFIKYIKIIRNRNYTIKIYNSADECVYGADIVTTCTTSTRPVFEGDYISEGTHINAVGSFTPYMQEIDSKTVVKTKKIIVDSRKEAWKVAGDLLVPLNEGSIARSKIFGELGDIVTGKIPGRENEKEITIYESVGFAALDIALAIAAYQKSLKLGVGTELDWSK
jgi:ornithine cyclodeaminase/alanine dehydrogenase-like protein (mu-crystallin family)